MTIKTFLKTIIIFSFFLGYSQEGGFNKKIEKSKYPELYYELGETILSDSGDNILTTYLVKNSDRKTIGTIEENDDQSRYNYYNLNKKIVAWELIYDNNINKGMFVSEKSISVNAYIGNSLSIYKRIWDSSENRYEIVLNGKAIAYISENKSNNIWEVFNFSQFTPFSRLYVDIFDITKKNALGYVIDADKKSDFGLDYVKYTGTGVEQKKKSRVKRIKKKKTIDYPYGFGLSVSQDAGGGKVSKTRLAGEYHLFGDSMGITVGFAKSDTGAYVEEDGVLTDWDIAFTYGYPMFKLKFLKIKAGLGYYSENYEITESFGPFYDIGGGLYYSAGLQLYIPLDKNGITIDIYNNNSGIGYGLGYKF